MTLKQYRKKHSFYKTKAIASCLYQFTGNETNDEVKEIIKTSEIEFEITDENIVALVSLVNKEIKDPDCPNSKKNKFYVFKHKFINKLLKKGKVDKVLESENCFHFYIGDYSFHQPKFYYPLGIEKIDGNEVFIEEEHFEKFNLEDYNKCLIALIDRMMK